MNAAVLDKYGVIKWRQVDRPEVGDGDILVKVDYASICGSDQHIFKGEFHPRTKLPFVPGHEFAGHVAEVGRSVIRFRTDGTNDVLVIIDGGDNEYPDPARPGREGSKAVLNAFELIAYDR